MTRDQCLPEGTPLVSSVGELAEDRIHEWKAKASASFPGRGVLDDKPRWYHELSESVLYSHIMMGEPSRKTSCPLFWTRATTAWSCRSSCSGAREDAERHKGRRESHIHGLVGTGPRRLCRAS